MAQVGQSSFDSDANFSKKKSRNNLNIWKGPKKLLSTTSNVNVNLNHHHHSKFDAILDVFKAHFFENIFY